MSIQRYEIFDNPETIADSDGKWCLFDDAEAREKELLAAVEAAKMDAEYLANALDDVILYVEQKNDGDYSGAIDLSNERAVLRAYRERIGQ